jgi:hypothetical protein
VAAVTIFVLSYLAVLEQGRLAASLGAVARARWLLGQP